MLCADDLVRSGRVMVAFLDGPSAGLILEVFVVDGTAILHFNLGLVRIGPQLFVFAFGRSLRRVHLAQVENERGEQRAQQRTREDLAKNVPAQQPQQSPIPYRVISGAETTGNLEIGRSE